MSKSDSAEAGRELPTREPTASPRRVDRARFKREFPSGDPTATECAQNLVWAAELFLEADTRALRRHGLSTAARILLATLEGAGEPLSQTAIADRLLVTGASVTSLVDTLERKKLVTRTRDRDDRRVVLVELTEAARPVIDEFLAEVTRLHAAEFAVLDEGERETLTLLLAKVATSIQSVDVEKVLAGTKPRRR